MARARCQRLASSLSRPSISGRRRQRSMITIELIGTSPELVGEGSYIRRRARLLRGDPQVDARMASKETAFDARIVTIERRIHIALFSAWLIRPEPIIQLSPPCFRISPVFERRNSARTTRRKGWKMPAPTSKLDCAKAGLGRLFYCPVLLLPTISPSWDRIVPRNGQLASDRSHAGVLHATQGQRPFHLAHFFGVREGTIRRASPSSTVANRADAMENRASLLGYQVRYLHSGDHFVANMHWCFEVERLRNVDTSGPRQLGAEYRRDVRGGEDPARCATALWPHALHRVGRD